MKQKINLLIIDDHPMIIEGYKKVLLTYKGVNLHIITANTCDQAVREIQKSIHSNPFDIVFIDIQLPSSKDNTITSGEYIALLVNKELPKAKIIILTMIDNPNRLQNLIETIPHHGLLIKSDITSRILINALEKVLNNEMIYSKTIDLLRNKITQNDEILDEINKKIIYYLSKGVKTKNLTKYIPLSLSSIEKRKKYIKQLFDVDGDDEKLLIQAKKRGLF